MSQPRVIIEGIQTSGITLHIRHINRVYIVFTKSEKYTCISVTPRSRGYGDVTATYIRRSEIPSRIYAKHQYR